MCPQVRHQYSEAVSLYSTTRLSVKEICERTGVPFRAFISYLSRRHRDLILKRSFGKAGHAAQRASEASRAPGMSGPVRLRGSKGQTTAAHLKYRDAIAAASSEEFIEYNISQIARLFGLDGTGLGNQLRHHYPDVIPNRERERRRLGINDNVHHGTRPWCKEGYSQAVETLRTTDKTVEEVAAIFNVTYKGLRDHIACYHKDLVQVREDKRKEALDKEKARGQRTGTWSIHEPEKETEEKYSKAVEIFRTTSLAIEEIARMEGVNKTSLGAYLRQWHPDLIAQRRGYDKGTRLSDTKRYKKSTAEKYSEAIELLKGSDISTQAAAKRLGLNPEVFRAYLKEHEPELAASRGRVTAANGRMVSARSSEKYSEAIRLYATTNETLKSIAQRMGLTYNSLGNYIRRNYPELIEKHKRQP